MRFVSYALAGAEAAGVLNGQSVHPLPVATLLDAVELGPDGLRAAGEAGLAEPAVAGLDEVRLLAPLRPPSIRDFVAFEAHIEGVVQSLEGRNSVPEVWYPNPGFYFTNPHAVVGPYDDVPIPPLCQVFDFETEIGAVIGRSGQDLTPEQAREHIIGYTIFNDWSARDLQRPERELGLGFSKGKDSANTLGPCLVTADELERYRDAEGFLDLTMTVELNGQVLGKDSAASMSWTFDELVAYASRGTWVRPGDVLGSGTCGRGCLAEIWGRAGRREPPPLSAGDVVTLTVEGIGTISNRVVAGTAEVVALPPARRRDRGPRH